MGAYKQVAPTEHFANQNFGIQVTYTVSTVEGNGSK